MSKHSRKIKLFDAEYLVIDLTRPLKLEVEVYPDDPKPKRKIFSEINKTGCHHYIHELGDHNFQPHGDAPNHQNPDLSDKGFEVFDIEYCFNSSCLIDLSNSEGANDFDGIKYLVEVKKSHLIQFSEQLLKTRSVLIRTGYDKWLEENRPHNPKNLPYLDKDAAEFIESFDNIKVVGIDSITVDPVGSNTSHQALKNTLIVESIVHLYDIPKDKILNFYLQTSPVRIVGATGGPVVAYAFVKI